MNSLDRPPPDAPASCWQRLPALHNERKCAHWWMPVTASILLRPQRRVSIWIGFCGCVAVNRNPRFNQRHYLSLKNRVNQQGLVLLSVMRWSKSSR